MKRAKKLLAVLLALAMVLGMSATAFATGGSQSKATITGVEDEEGVTVTAYKIISYNSDGYYFEVLDGTIGKSQSADQKYPVLTPSSGDVQNLYYNKMDQLKSTATAVTFNKDETTKNYTCDNLEPGTWLVVVNGSKNWIYNPAIISVGVGENGNEYGTLNLDTETWNDGTEVYLKKDNPTITKTAEAASGNSDVKGTQYGDILKFTISADIPAYTSEKQDIQYSIKDTLTGLTIVSSDEYPVTVIVGEGAGDPAESAIAQAKVSSVIQDGSTSFEVNDFDRDFLIRNANKKITIQYYAKVTSTELINVDRLKNTAELKYSNNTTTGESSNSTSANTKHYTFGIDTQVTGWKDSGSTVSTGEFVKIDDKGTISYNITDGVPTVSKGDATALGGAEFQLHIGSEDGALFTDKQGLTTFTTNEDGRLQIVGLDDGVDYYLVETKAPTGYTLNGTSVKVRIEATYKEGTDELTGYQVNIGGDITYYGYDIVTGKTDCLNDKDHPSNPHGFKNTKLTELPSTGGIGTTIFTIGGCIIMICAAGLFFVSRRKKAED